MTLGRQPLPIERIPSELLSEILSHLETRDLLHAACVSRWWSEHTREALYKNMTLKSSRTARILVAQDHERGTKRPTRSLSMMVSNYGYSNCTAIINYSRALEQLELLVLDEVERMINILLLSGLDGEFRAWMSLSTKHFSMSCAIFRSETPVTCF